MAKITYAPGIQTVSGALAKPKKSGQHRHGDYVIATHRVAPTTNPDCLRLYIADANRYDRATPLSSDEIVARNRFKTVARAVATRAKDLSKITADTAAFLAQKDQPGGKKTMKSYLWSLELAAYDQAHDSDD